MKIAPNAMSSAVPTAMPSMSASFRCRFWWFSALGGRLGVGLDVGLGVLLGLLFGRCLPHDVAVALGMQYHDLASLLDPGTLGDDVHPLVIR